MTKILAIANQKGGVGKSTTTIQLSFFLTQIKSLVSKKKIKKGKLYSKNNRVLVIDFDPQGNTSGKLAGFGSQFGQYDYGDVTTTADLFSPDLKEIKVFSCPVEGIDLIPTPKNCPVLTDIEQEDVNVCARPNAYIEKIKDDYDYIILDCPPSLGRKLLAALTLATHVVCPIKLSGFALDGLEGLLTTIKKVKTNYNPALKNIGVYVNDKDNDEGTEQVYQQIVDAIPSHMLFKSVINHRPPLDKSITLGSPIWDNRYGHVAAKETISLLEEIMDKVVA